MYMGLVLGLETDLLSWGFSFRVEGSEFRVSILGFSDSRSECEV